MGVGHSCFGQSSPERLPEEESNDQNVNLTTLVMEFIKPRCFWTEEEKMKRQLQPKEKHQQQLNKAKNERTLEEWFIASPCLNKFGTISGGEYYVFKHFSNKIYPSPCLAKEDNVGSSFSLERQLKFDEDNRENMEPFSMIESKSRKGKKKVSFRLPEEADIFFFYSPEEFEE